jgi:hypothetical protein
MCASSSFRETPDDAGEMDRSLLPLALCLRLVGWESPLAPCLELIDDTLVRGPLLLLKDEYLDLTVS